MSRATAPWSVPPCRIAVLTPKAGRRTCVGLVDANPSTDTYAVHHFLDHALRAARAGLWPDPATSDLIFFNASFSRRHGLRYPCFDLLRQTAATYNTTPIWSVSFGEFFARYYHGPSLGPVADAAMHWSHVHYVVMDPTGHPADIVVPHAIARPCWLVGDCAPPPPPPWGARKLVFFAGHIPKARISSLRLALYRRLRPRSDASVFADGNDFNPGENISSNLH